MESQKQNKKISQGKGIIIIMSGYTATGKSQTAQQIAEFLRKNSIKSQIISSDVLRRQFNHRITADYFNDNNKECAGKRDHVYCEMLKAARPLFDFGYTVILDAGHNKRHMRERIYDFAKECGADFIVVNTVCPDEEEIRKRIGVRNPENPNQVANLFEIYLLSRGLSDPIIEDVPLIIFDTKDARVVSKSDDSSAEFISRAFRG